MTTDLTPAAPLPVTGATTSPAVRAVLASLPGSFRTGGTVDGSVSAVDGSTGWATAARAAVDHGATAVVVTEPGRDDPEAVEALAGVAADRGAAIVLAEGWAANPAVIAALDAWADDVAAADFIEAELLLPDERPGQEQVLTMLRLLRAVERPLPTSATASAVNGGVLVVARRNGATWTLLSARTAGPARLHLSASNADVQVELDLPSPQTATPALARRIDADRETRLDALYESGHRRAWRRLKDAIGAGSSGSDDLAAFAADLRAADAAVAQFVTDDDTTKEDK